MTRTTGSEGDEDHQASPTCLWPPLDQVDLDPPARRHLRPVGGAAVEEDGWSPWSCRSRTPVETDATTGEKAARRRHLSRYGLASGVSAWPQVFQRDERTIRTGHTSASALRVGLALVVLDQFEQVIGSALQDRAESSQRPELDLARLLGHQIRYGRCPDRQSDFLGQQPAQLRAGPDLTVGRNVPQSPSDLYQRVPPSRSSRAVSVDRESSRSSLSDDIVCGRRRPAACCPLCAPGEGPNIREYPVE